MRFTLTTYKHEAGMAGKISLKLVNGNVGWPSTTLMKLRLKKENHVVNLIA